VRSSDRAQPVQLTALGYIVEKIGTTERVLPHAVAQQLPPTGSGGHFEIDLASWLGSLGRLWGHFGASGLLGQYLDLVKIQFLASASVSKSPM
jgi:hypothetical protein